MKRLTTFIIFLLGISLGQAQNISFTLLSSNQNEAVVKVDFGTYQTETVSVNGVEMQKLHMADAYPVLKAGSPELLQTAFSLIIPEGCHPETEILDAQYTVVEHFALAPSKGRLYRNVNPENVAYTTNQDYQANGYLLGSSIISGDQYLLRDYHGMNFKVYPFDYNPTAQKLKIYSSVTVKVTFNGTRSFSVPTKNNRTFDAVYANQFLNYRGLRGTPVDEEGDILIIAPENFMEAMQPYADWKIRNGYPTEIVPLTSVGNNANAIKSFILNYYNEHNLAFVLIVGDNAQFSTPTVSGNKSDNYFTELVGNDSYPDIILGKISAENIDQVQTQVQRFIEYEQNPTQVEHFPVFMGVASNQGPGDNNEYDYQHIRNINNKLLNYTYTSGYELFEGSQGGLDAAGNPTASMVTTAVNNGIGIACYCGHGAEQQWVTTDFNNNNVNALTNVGKLPFILSVACVNGEYHTGTCFAEAWLRATHNDEPTGAVGFLGSTINQPWNSPMCAQDAMIDLLIGNTSLGQKFTYGGMFYNGMIKMLDVYNDVEVFRTWILFGDPTLQMRTDVPQPLELNYTSTLPMGVPSVTFSSSIENAKVTIIKDGEIIGSGRIQNGEYLLPLNETFLPADSIKVLATATNYLPFEGLLQFIPNDGPYVIVGDANLTEIEILGYQYIPNGLAEYGEFLQFAAPIINIGNNTASNIRIHATTDDEYITIQNPDFTVASLSAQDTLAADLFIFKVKDVVPAKHNSVIHLDIFFNNDTVHITKQVKLHAPVLKLGSLAIDDSQSGNNNHRADYGESFTGVITLSNIGNMEALPGKIFLSCPGNEIIFQDLELPTPVIDENGTVTIPFQATISDNVQETTISYVKVVCYVHFYRVSAYFPIKIGAVVEDWETGDFMNMAWQNASSIPWTLTTQLPHSGTYCAKSGAISSNSNTRLSVSVSSSQPDTISFYYKVSSEENDKLTFKIDGQTKGEWGGIIGWTRAAFPVGAGSHTYSWTYTKDYYGNQGRDCALIDDIEFPGGVVNVPVGIVEQTDGQSSFQIWPNPATEYVHIQLNDPFGDETYTYQLFTLSGKLLQGGQLLNNRTDIDVSNYVSGVYILKMEDRDHHVETSKIIKK